MATGGSILRLDGRAQDLASIHREITAKQAQVVDLVKNRVQWDPQATEERLECSRLTDEALLHFDFCNNFLTSWLRKYGPEGFDTIPDAGSGQLLVEGDNMSIDSEYEGMMAMYNEFSRRRLTRGGGARGSADSDNPGNVVSELRKLSLTEMDKQMKELKGELHRTKMEQAISREQALVVPFDTMAIKEFNEDLCDISRDVCDRKVHHDNFIPCDDFCVDHLPEGYRDQEIVKCIKQMAQLSGRVKVGAISTNRPHTFPGSTRQYPFSGRGGDDNLVRQGSGFVNCSKTKNSPCLCVTCENSASPPAQRHGIITVLTATHLVFDSTECEHTEVELDLGGGGDTVTLTGGRWVDVIEPVSCDLCGIEFITHDMDLVSRLDTLVGNTGQAVGKIGAKYDRGTNHGGLAIMFSHPHGVGKARVSVGVTKQTNRKQIKGRKYFQLSTTLTTCVGCSGAPVWPVGLRAPYGKFMCDLLHSERTDDGQISVWYIE